MSIVSLYMCLLDIASRAHLSTANSFIQDWCLRFQRHQLAKHHEDKVLAEAMPSRLSHGAVRGVFLMTHGQASR